MLLKIITNLRLLLNKILFSHFKKKVPDVDSNSANSGTLVQFFTFLYVALVGALIFFSLSYSNNNKKAIPIFYAVSTILGIYMLASFVFMIYSVINILVTDI
jgi:hypothetical protein